MYLYETFKVINVHGWVMAIPNVNIIHTVYLKYYVSTTKESKGARNASIPHGSPEQSTGLASPEESTSAQLEYSGNFIDCMYI